MQIATRTANEIAFAVHRIRPFVLVAAAMSDAARLALLRGDRIARAFRAELRVVYGAQSDARTRERQKDRIRAWCETVLGRAFRNVDIETGDTVQATLVVARTQRPAVVVVGAGAGIENGRAAQTALHIHRESGRPVLLARRPIASATILAATHLSEPTAPILLTAQRMAARLRADLALLHDVPSCARQSKA
jgi:hypothetical protein